MDSKVAKKRNLVMHVLSGKSNTDHTFQCISTVESRKVITDYVLKALSPVCYCNKEN